jgi:hypothetical protein
MPNTGIDQGIDSGLDQVFVAPIATNTGSGVGAGTALPTGMVGVAAVFEFDPTDAGQTVVSQVLNNLSQPFAGQGYVPDGMVDQGSGDFGCTYALPAGYYGFARAEVITGPNAGTARAFRTVPLNASLAPVTISFS